MKSFIITGDLQIKAWQQFSRIRKNGMNSRLYYCLKVFDIILATAKERGIKRVLLNGDIFEDKGWIETETYTETYKKLEMLHDNGIEIVLNPGNHDVYAELPGRTIHALTPFRRLTRVVEKPQQVWKDVWVVPWMSNPQRFKEAVRTIPARASQILVCHCGVQGARTGPTSYLVRNPVKLQDIRPSDFRLILLSDYHTRQDLAPNVHYLGSPLQHSFGEIHKPCIWSISDSGCERIYTNLPRFRRIQVSSLQELLDKAEGFQGDYVAILYTGKAAEDVPADHIAEIAGKHGFQFTLDAEGVGAEEGTAEEFRESSVFEPRRAIARFLAKANLPNRRKARLEKIGLRLYNGE